MDHRFIRTGAVLSARVAPTLFGSARVVAGILWLHEGLFKYRAGFGAADIRLVAHSAGDTRVPAVFATFAEKVLGRYPEAFGALMPAVECALGIALILGVATRLTALAAAVALATYWAADQLIGQYPLMAILSATVLAGYPAAQRYSLTTMIRSRRGRRSGGHGVDVPHATAVSCVNLCSHRSGCDSRVSRHVGLS